MTVIECYVCSQEVGLGDKMRFIKFDMSTKMVHSQCYKKVEEFIEELRNETKNA